jgi:hypothetical protein
VGSVVVIIPSRGRPQRAWEAVQAARETAVLVSTSIVLAVDADDPTLPEYRALRWHYPYAAETALVVLAGEETGDLVRATNTVSMRVAHADPTAIIGNLGDDHVCRTPGWDKAVAEALAEPGIAYGDDRFQGQELPTAPFISASIVLTLGWYALPSCRHLFVDNVWRDIGVQAGVLHYLPDVVIEHMHPLNGKGDWDPGYEKANGTETVERDKVSYLLWRRSGMADDIERVRQRLAA